MCENTPELLSKRYENLIPPNSTLFNARTVFGEHINETLGEIIFRKNLKCIAIVGEPGSGKTIISKEVANIVKKNRTDKVLEFFYYDDIHEFIQYITNAKSGSWAKLRDQEKYPDLWALSSTIVLFSVLEALQDPTKLIILEGVFCGKEDRLRSTILKLFNLFGEGSLGIIPVVPHPDTQQSAVMIRDAVEVSLPNRVIEVLRMMNTEPNKDFRNGDCDMGTLIKKDFEKSATGAEISELSHENRRLAEEVFHNMSPDLEEIYQEILSPQVPEMSYLTDFGDITRIKALAFIDSFGKAGVDVTPIINMPMRGTINLYISPTTEKVKLNISFIKQLARIISEKRQSNEWDYKEIRKWFPNLGNIQLT
ncbi:MAG TPA: hypothetical protein VF185_04700 [Patescibacteria group bacterium]